MAYSDNLLLPVIRQYARTGEPLTATRLSELSGVPFDTVKDRLVVLTRAGVIRRKGSGRRWGYTYEITNDTTTA